MARGASIIRQRDVTALVKAVVAAGREVERLEVDKAGNVIAWVRRPGDVASVAADGDLDRELAEFEARNG
jgi:hypothetical protein